VQERQECGILVLRGERLSSSIVLEPAFPNSRTTPEAGPMPPASSLPGGNVDDLNEFASPHSFSQKISEPYVNPNRINIVVWNCFEEECSRSEAQVRQAQRRVLPPEVDETHSTLA